MNFPVSWSEPPPSSQSSPNTESSTSTQELPISEEIPPEERVHPIPPPSQKKQYRAIGLIKGKFQRFEAEKMKGKLITADGLVIDTVLLGRMIGLVKKHLDLEKEHLWVVYPHTRQENDDLHLQIVGVWEPEILHKTELSLESNQGQSETLHPLSFLLPKPEPGYFSIRGEVIFATSESETIIVKIRQSPKRQGENPKFSKLKVRGSLPEKPVKRFWDLQVQLQGNILVLQQAIDLGLITPKKPPFNKEMKKPLLKFKEEGSSSPKLGGLSKPTKKLG